MGYEVRPDGTIIAQTMEEAVALARRLSRGQQALPLPITSSSGHRASAQEEHIMPPSVKKLLEAGAAAGKEGAKSGDLAMALGIENAKGISTTIQMARKIILPRANGLPVEHFLKKQEGANGTRWIVNGDALREIGLL